MHKVHDLFTVGSGEAMLQLIPPFQCRRHCQSVAMPIGPGDIGMSGPRRTETVFLSINNVFKKVLSFGLDRWVLEARLTPKNIPRFYLIKSKVRFY